MSATNEKDMFIPLSKVADTWQISARSAGKILRRIRVRTFAPPGMKARFHRDDVVAAAAKFVTTSEPVAS